MAGLLRNFGRWWKWLGLLLAAGLLVVGGGIIWLWNASQRVPEFYQRELAIAPVEAAAAGDRLERQVLQLRNEAVNEDHFQVTFTAEEINGWLASDLIEKFPQVLPSQVKDPRVALEPETLIVGCRYEDQGATTVISVRCQVTLLVDQDVIALQLMGLQAGDVPIPVAPLLDKLVEELERRQLPIRWEEKNGNPVALVPMRLADTWIKDRRIELQAIQIDSTGITVAGRSLKDDTEQTQERSIQREIPDEASSDANSSSGTNSRNHKSTEAVEANEEPS